MIKHNKNDTTAAKEIISVFAASSPHIEIENNKLVSIEGYMSILEYDENIIRIECENISVKITGDSLEINNIFSERINVLGNIFSVEFSS